jgi:cell division protein ZapA (FtsZ GTPase activity inhibitor)
MNQTKQVKVSIFGELYSFISDEPEARVLEAARKVDMLMRELAGKGSQPDLKKIAVLIAVQAVSEQFSLQAQQEAEQLKQRQLIDLIDREMYAIATGRS